MAKFLFIYLFIFWYSSERFMMGTVEGMHRVNMEFKARGTFTCMGAAIMSPSAGH